MNPFTVLKQLNKDDLKYIRGPVLALLGFLVITAVIFPKPSRIYHGGVLKKCSCFGLEATPRHTQAVGVGDSYCLGVPIKCEVTQVLKNADE